MEFLVLGVVIVLFNLIFLMISKNVNEAFVNSLALLFNLNMDDTLKPGWDEVMLDSLVVCNVSCYFAAEGDVDGGDYQVDIIDSIRSSACPCSEEDYKPLLESGDKVYFEATKLGDELVVTVQWSGRYYHAGTDRKTVKFRVRGTNGRDLFDKILEFQCVKGRVLDKYDDIKGRRMTCKEEERAAANHIVKNEDQVISFGCNSSNKRSPLKFSRPVYRLASFDALASKL
jgi:hypothetical protein